MYDGGKSNSFINTFIIINDRPCILFSSKVSLLNSKKKKTHSCSSFCIPVQIYILLLWNFLEFEIIIFPDNLANYLSFSLETHGFFDGFFWRRLEGRSNGHHPIKKMKMFVSVSKH